MPSILIPKQKPHLLVKTKSKWGQLKLPYGQFIGEIINGQPGLYGHISYKNGDKIHYDGEFANGVPNGSGMLTYHNGDKYKGSFKNGLPDGHGIKLYTNASGFVGPFKNGNEDGVGILEVFMNGNYHPYLATYVSGKRITQTMIQPSSPLAVKALGSIYDEDFN